jgi:hypothetical protein
MKSLIKKTAKSKFGISIRNFLGYRSVFLSNKYNNSKSASISDAFPWRTDNGYETTFRFSDILNIFYEIQESTIEILIYSNSNKILKKILINDLNFSNEVLINKKLLNGLEDYGVFYIFHRFNDVNFENINISNKCYVGFSNNGSLPSFVHGMSYVRYKSLDNKDYGDGLIQSSFFKQKYRIQKSFANSQRAEFFIANPTSKRLKFSICDTNYIIKQGCTLLVDIMSEDDVTLTSTCLFLRPVIFNYNNDYFDVFHG